MSFSKNSAADLATGATPTELIDKRIADLSDWRGNLLAQLRKIIHEALPEVQEEWKWGKPVWSHNGLICTGEVYKAAVKTTFARGAAVADPEHLFNSSMDGNVRRAIDFAEGATINGPAFKELIRAAARVNAEANPSKTRK